MVAYFFPRLALPTSNEEMVDDQLPDEHLFSILMLSPWFVDIENNLVTERFPSNISSREKNKILRETSPFTWIRENIFRLGPDQILKRCVR